MPPELEKSISLLLKKLEHVRDRELPVRVGRAVVYGIRDNFNRGGFYGEPWKTPIRSKAGFRGATGRYGPLLSGTNHLRDSTDYIPGTGRVTIRNTSIYADEEVLLGEALRGRRGCPGTEKRQAVTEQESRLHTRGSRLLAQHGLEKDRQQNMHTAKEIHGRIPGSGKDHRGRNHEGTAKDYRQYQMIRIWKRHC